MKQDLTSEVLKEFVTVEYELTPPATVPSPKNWLNSLLSLLLSPVMKFFSAFNHLEENGLVSSAVLISRLIHACSLSNVCKRITTWMQHNILT